MPTIVDIIDYINTLRNDNNALRQKIQQLEAEINNLKNKLAATIPPDLDKNKQ